MSVFLRPDLESTPIVAADVDYFVDGSCLRDHLGNHAGFAGGRFYTVKKKNLKENLKV